MAEISEVSPNGVHAGAAGGPAPEASTAALTEPRLGEILMAEQLLSPAQLERALDIQRELESYRPLGQILVDQRILTEEQLRYVLDYHQKRTRLGAVLVRSGALSQAQLASALARQRTTGLPLGQTLIELSYIGETDLRKALCLQLNIAFVDLDQYLIDPELGGLINASYARKHGLVPIARVGDHLTVAMDDPANAAVVDEIRSSTGLTIGVVTSTHAAIARAYSRVYETRTLGTVVPSRVELVTAPSESAGGLTRGARYADKDANELVRELIKLAAIRGASDIHLETLDGRCQLRLRIDGTLHPLGVPSLEQAIGHGIHAVISRMKILANLDIAERRRPQDGSFRARIARGHVLDTFDFRVSIVPGYHGENVVLRVLDPKRAPRSLTELGFSRQLTEMLTALLRRPTGMMVICGPTGSGKTTTLYAALTTLYRPDIRILTAENPIEYVYEQFTQCEVNDKIGNTFASYLRSFLRHDPEVIMVGEVRDEETAEIAFRGAQTGHLLLTTLHTNDAVSAVTRLRDLRVEPNVITSALAGVLSQRLIRRLCASCREFDRPSPEIMREFFEFVPDRLRFYRGRGCEKCNFTGYRGRLAVGELWIPGEEDIILINKDAPLDAIKASAEKRTLLMAMDVWDRLADGHTTLEELMRALPYPAIRQFRTVGQRVRAAMETGQPALGARVNGT